MLARLLVIIGGLLALVLFAALAVPPFIDWTGYRADFEREASAILNRKVEVRGEARARLLPFPSLTFTDVVVGGEAAGQPSMTVDTFSMDAELAPFLRGEILIFDMRLERPRAVIGLDEDGKVDWAPHSSSPFDAAQIAIESLTITDGEVKLRHGSSQRTHVLSNINASVSARSLLGPWRLDGFLLFDGEYSDISATTGRVDEEGRMRLRLQLRPDAYAVAIESDGNLSLEEGRLNYAGQFKLAQDKAGVPDAENAAIAPVKPEPGYRVSGQFFADHRKLTLDEFRFETGPADSPYAADGTAFLDYGPQPHFGIEASGAQVQLDEALAGEGFPVQGLAERIEAVERTLHALPHPAIPGSVDVKLPAVVAGDTTIRDIHLAAEPTQAGWLIHSLGASLPGRTRLEAEGVLDTGEAFGFRGHLLLAVAQPSGFAAWLAKDVDEAVRRLPAAGFSAAVDLSASHQHFNNLELMLGDTKFTGHMEATHKGDVRPSVALALKGGALDVEGLSAFASIFVSSEGVNRFAAQDLDLDIQAGPVDAWGLVAEQVDTVLRLRGAVLEIDRLALTGLAGASISATGRISDFPDKPAGRFDASLVALDLAPLVSVLEQHYGDHALIAGLGERIRTYPGLLEEARIDAVVSLATEKNGANGLAVSAQGEAGGSAFSASFSGQNKQAGWLDSPLSVTLGVRNQDATALLVLAGLPVLPLGLTGPGEVDILADGDLRDGMKTHALLTGDDFRASFEGVLSGEDGPALRGRLTLEAADIEPWLMTAGAALPGMGLGSSGVLDADVDYADGLLIFNTLSGTMNESAFSGDINVGLKAGKPHITGKLLLDDLDIAPLAAMLMGDGVLNSTGQDWSVTPFAATSTAPFSAELDLSVSALLVGHRASLYDAFFLLKLDSEQLRLQDFEARMFDGTVTGLLELKNAAGTGLFNAQMSLADAALGSMLSQTGLSGKVDVSAAFSSSGKSLDVMVKALSGSGTAGLKDLQIANLNEAGLPALLQTADEIGRDIDARKVAEFAPDIVASGNFAAQDTSLAFTIANGVLRVPPVRLSGDLADIPATVSASLFDGEVTVQGALAYRAGEDALVGSDPVVNFTVEGPLDGLQRQFDSAPLAQYLTQRSLEHEQQRVEAMQAELLEKQRLRREAAYYADLQAQRERAALVEEKRRQQEAEARARAEEAERVRVQQAEQAAREEQERLRREAQELQEAQKAARAKEEAQKAAREKEEARRAKEQPRVERVPLPPLVEGSDGAAPLPSEPFTLRNLLRSLGSP
ncbi:AsmA-like C-terminal region-containing protein [Aquamicrobium segne]|uniref:AsmA-like C-terminal region-containing protein n=1 Tax=Aquamicrobium segne TaxID=469547 RepID=A0ABW0H0G3_9HYPH